MIGLIVLVHTNKADKISLLFMGTCQPSLIMNWATILLVVEV